jgi:predicted lysophospholipase L1 biosynthesis ABC-type transport system permease subunit
MQAREKVHDLGIHKALGMTPRQVITMVTCWAVAPAIIATAIALPAGAALEPMVARAIVSAQANPVEDITPLLPAPSTERSRLPAPAKPCDIPAPPHPREAPAPAEP